MNITLCGSARFKDLFIQVNEQLSKHGHVVYSMASFMAREQQELEADEKETLDLVHLAKILNSDAVVWVTDESDYIGDSTRRELKWAKMLGKDIYHIKGVASLCANGPLRGYPTIAPR